MEKHMGESMKIIAYHELTRVEVAKWDDPHHLLLREYTTLELRTQLASDFHFCTLKEALEIVTTQLYSAYGGDNHLMVIAPGTKEFVIGKDELNFRELSSNRWHAECWKLQREIRDVRSGWHLK